MSRSASMKQSRQDKLDRIFKGRRWRLEREVHLPEGQVFQTPLGTKGRHGYLIFDPDWKPIVWTEAERAKGQAWGLQTVSSFHTRGTPPVEGFD